jgi:hypothetical protein
MNGNNGQEWIEGILPMDMNIAQLNIGHFRMRLSENPDDATRRTLLRLLAEEEKKLASMTSAPQERMTRR